MKKRRCILFGAIIVCAVSLGAKVGFECSWRFVVPITNSLYIFFFTGNGKCMLITGKRIETALEKSLGKKIEFDPHDDRNKIIMRKYFESLKPRSYLYMGKFQELWQVKWTSITNIEKFDYAGNRYVATVHLKKLLISWWHVSLLFFLPVLVWCCRSMFRKGRKGICSECGYNLRGNVSGVCPECGRSLQSSFDSVQQSRLEEPD